MVCGPFFPSPTASTLRMFDVLVCTPLRLVSLIKKEVISLAAVKVLCLDEADKLLELGFLEQVRQPTPR